MEKKNQAENSLMRLGEYLEWLHRPDSSSMVVEAFYPIRATVYEYYCKTGPRRHHHGFANQGSV